MLKKLVFTTAFLANVGWSIFHVFCSGRCPEGGNPLASIACFDAEGEKSVPTKGIASSSEFQSAETLKQTQPVRDFNYSKKTIDRQR